ncbi:Lysozyme, putative [Ricinus communis]|uniref:Lysozyme, putative n=1 Tax=Ricinus communis TaxID=3988 RepID=B9TBF9_RICCO|nr:Lysozyme, putative [Ricinus communis]
MTTTGGKVISASSHGSINGVAIALEGDVIFCPACKLEGKIVCAGARIPETWNGKNVALENDLCACGCTSHPRLVPNQSVKYQITGEADADMPQATAPATNTVMTFDDKYVLIDEETGIPLAKTEYALRRTNGQAFLKAIAEAEGGGYDFKYGAVKGKRNDPWRFTDFSTHPGHGCDGVTTAAGMYQINKATWQYHGEGRMGRTDFTPETQDLIAVSILRDLGIIDKIEEGDIESGLSAASHSWAALPVGRGSAGRHNQPHVTFEHFEAAYRAAGGTTR